MMEKIFWLARLGNDEKTIQGKIEAIISQMTGETIEIIGSGRTDDWNTRQRSSS